MTLDILLLCVAAFSAAFLDAVVGGGGLIQTPAALILLPQYPVAAVIGSLKIPAFTGTSMATVQYAIRVQIRWRSFMLIVFVAFLSAMSGSLLLQMIQNRFMKPIILVIL